MITTPVGLGQVVQLRSGGPDMTIAKIETELGSERTVLSCYWFDALAVREFAFNMLLLRRPCCECPLSLDEEDTGPRSSTLRAGPDMSRITYSASPSDVRSVLTSIRSALMAESNFLPAGSFDLIGLIAAHGNPDLAIAVIGALHRALPQGIQTVTELARRNGSLGLRMFLLDVLQREDARL